MIFINSQNCVICVQTKNSLDFRIGHFLYRLTLTRNVVPQNLNICEMVTD